MGGGGGGGAGGGTAGGGAGGGGGAIGGGAGGGGAGDGTLSSLDPAAMAQSAFKLPLDAALSPDGKTAYFVALDPAQSPSVFKVAATGAMGSPAVLASGDPLAAPFGLDVSTDGSQLVLADSSALDANGLDHGCLFTLGTSAAGAPAQVPGTAGYQPRSVVIVQENHADVAYFTGHDATDHAAGVFKVALSGGAVSVVAKGAPFGDPSGLAVSSNGTVYVADAIATEAGHAQLLKVSGGDVSTVIADLAVGYPAGVALSQDETVVLVSALDPSSGTDLVIRYDLTASSQTSYSTGISTFSESAGLKRARLVDTYVWADSHANGGGTVFVINKQQ